jgi:O-antigen/teichoic acid export membrane protein
VICEVDVLPEVELVSEPKSYGRRLIKGSVIVFTSFIGAEIVGMFLRIFLSRSLSVEEYGLFYATFSLISFFAIFRDLGLGSALVKYISEFAVHKKFADIKSSITTVLIVLTALGFVVSAVLFIFSHQIALAFFGKNNSQQAVSSLMILSAWFFVMVFYTLMQQAFQGFQNMLAYSSINFFNILAVLLLAVLFVSIFRIGVGGVALAYLIAAVVIGILSMIFFIRGYPQVFREKASVSKPLLKKLFVFALPLFLAGLGGLIISYTDTIFITLFRTLPEVGFFQAAQPTAKILWYLPSTLTVVLYPMISELWAKREKKLLGGALRFLTKFSFILIIPFAFILIAFPEVVINLLFGSKYLAAATALQILSVAAIIYAPYEILVYAVAGIGKPSIITKVVLSMAFFNLVGNLALIPRYGIEGAAVATLMSFTIGLTLMFYYTRKFIRYTIPSSPLLKTAVGGVLTLLLIFGLKFVLVLPTWPKAFAVMIPSLLFYAVWILVSKAITRDDLKLIARIVPMPGWLVKIAEKLVGG